VEKIPQMQGRTKGLIQGTYFGNGFEEHLGKLWESLGTWSEHIENRQTPPPQPPFLKMKKKKLYPLVQAESSHWLHEISISKVILSYKTWHKW